VYVNQIGETGLLGLVFLIFPLWGLWVASWFWQRELASG